MVEVGQGAKIVHIVDHLRHSTFKRLYRWWGDLVYVIAGLIALKKQKITQFSVKVENHAKHEACQRAVFSCMATYSKGWSMTPGARFDDGELDFVTIHRSGFIAFISQIIASSRRKKIRRSWVHYGVGQRFEIVSQSLMFIQADGDPVNCSDSLQIEIIPSAYKILAPPSSS
jgi:diacylglycerol kinase family enzyme